MTDKVTLEGEDKMEEIRLDESLPKPIDCDVIAEAVKYGEIGGYVVLTLKFAPGVDKKGIEEYAKQLSAIFKAQIREEKRKDKDV